MNAEEAKNMLQHDHDETVKEQDQERHKNNKTFDSNADDEYSTGHSDTGYSEKTNQSRFTDENDYPDGNTEKFDSQTNERDFGRNNPMNENGRAYDRAADYEREHENEQPFINQQPDQFYGRRETVDGEGKPSEQISSDGGQRHFTGNMGFHTKHERDDEINKAVTRNKK